MKNKNSRLTGTAGEHYVAYLLSKMGYIAAIPREGSPTADILAADLSGARTVAIQVKTTESAVRTRGRGSKKQPFEVQFPLGQRAIEHSSPHIIFAFVDLRGMISDAMPDVYIIPACDIQEYYKDWDIRKYSYFRLHWPIETVVKYKNNWEPVTKVLGEPQGR